MKPAVSVIMPSYNHNAYIKLAIKSVLEQTYRDLELVIVDDGSTDGSQEYLRELKDTRIRVDFFDQNRGACAAMNQAIRLAEGKYIAVCNSDDMWQPDKLQQQIAVIEKSESMGAVFSDVVWIDESGANLTDMHAPPIAKVFNQKNRSRPEWIRRLLLSGNCLCHPSAVVRREAYAQVGLYNNFFRQLPDFDMWLRILQQYDIFVIDSPLVRFRWFAGGENTSAPSTENSRRTMNERIIISRNIIEAMSADVWVSAFGFRHPIEDDLDLRIEKALFMIETPPGRVFLRTGLAEMYMLLADPEAEHRLKRKHGFDVLSFHEAMGKSQDKEEEARRAKELGQRARF